MIKRPVWDADRWKAAFNKAVWAQDSYRMHELRIEVFKDTVQDVLSGSYTADSGVTVTFDDPAAMQQGTTKYDRIENPGSWPVAQQERRIDVIEGDTLTVTKLLQQRGERPMVLNMANRHNPGGGVRSGSGAQEEYLFRCSNYFQSLYQFIDYAQSYGITERTEHYPMDRDHGGIYSPQVTVYRSSEADGYQKTDMPLHVDFAAVAAISSPALFRTDAGEYRLKEAMEVATSHKIRTIFRMALLHGHTEMVLGAFGCGAFANPPHHMAQLFHQILDEPEFRTAFSHVVFAIIENHNSYHWFNPQGNLLPFTKEFAAEGS